MLEIFNRADKRYFLYHRMHDGTQFLWETERKLKGIECYYSLQILLLCVSYQQ